MAGVRVSSVKMGLQGWREMAELSGVSSMAPFRGDRIGMFLIAKSALISHPPTLHI